MVANNTITHGSLGRHVEPLTTTKTPIAKDQSSVVTTNTKGLDIATFKKQMAKFGGAVRTSGYIGVIVLVLILWGLSR